MLVYGHRGSSTTHPENTLASFRAALEAGCHGIELDVWNSADNVPVVIHDRELERTTNGSGNVDDTPLSELQKLDAGDGEMVPTLAQVLELAPISVHLDIEVKGQDTEDGILEALGERSRSSWAISSSDWSVLRKFRKRNAHIDLWVLTASVTDEAIEEASRLRATTLAVNQKNFDPKAAERVSETGLRVMAWTANETDQCRRLQEMGVHALCTDDPARILKTLGSAKPAGTIIPAGQ